MRKKRITVARRTTQVISLFFLIYGGYFLQSRVLSRQDADAGIFPLLSPPEDAISTTQFERGTILWPSGEHPVFENYPPSLICRFNPEGGLFKACIVHFVHENLTWRTPFKYLIPHLALFALLCFLLGRFWCGWVCPLGTVGDFLTMIRKKLNIPARRFKPEFQRGMRFSSYGILAITTFISILIGLPWLSRFQCYWFIPYCQVCPARLICPVFGLIKPGWKDFGTTVASMFTILAWVFLGIFISAFFFGRRIWCHICPVGLVNAWFNRGAGLELRKNSLKCNKCGLCAEACPMDLTEMYDRDKDGVYNQSGCIMCMRCIEICPRDKCLSVNFFGKKITESKIK